MYSAAKPAVLSLPELEAAPQPFAGDSLETLGRQETAELMDIARCPRCRGPLVARMSCRGPYFFCLCVESMAGPQ